MGHPRSNKLAVLVAIAVLLLVWHMSGLSLCSLIGGIWCYNPGLFWGEAIPRLLLLIVLVCIIWIANSHAKSQRIKGKRKRYSKGL